MGAGTSVQYGTSFVRMHPPGLNMDETKWFKNHDRRASA